MCYMNVSYDKEQRIDKRDRGTDGIKKGGLAVFAISPSQRLNLATSL